MESKQNKSVRRLNWRDALIAVILISFVLRVYILADPLQEPVYQMLYGLLYAAMAAVTLRCAAFTKEKGCKLALLCFVWAVVCCALQRYTERETYQLSSYLLMMLFSLFSCYALAFVLEPVQARRALKHIGGVYVLLMFALSCAGLYAALTATTLPSISGAGYIPVVFESGRLTLFCYPTAAAGICCLALLVGLCLLLDTKRMFGKILLLIALLVIYAALALTDSRTSIAFFSACFGALGYLVAGDKLGGKRPLPRFALSVCTAVLAMAFAFAGTRIVAKAVASLADTCSSEKSISSARPGEIAKADAAISMDVSPLSNVAGAVNAVTLQASAPASEEPAGISAAADAPAEDAQEAGGRSLFYNITTLQGRTFAWEGAIKAVRSEPMLLLFGSSPLFVMDRVAPYIPQLFAGEPFSHLHSIFFQTLIAYGLPGLILFGTLACYILFHALRLFFMGRGHASLAERALTLVLFFCLAVDLLETFLTFGDVMRHSNPWFFLIAGYVVYLSATRIPARGKKAHTAE